MLLEQRHQEIDGQVNVLHELIFVHGHVSDGDAQAQDLKENVQVLEDGIHLRSFRSEHRRHRLVSGNLPLRLFSTKHETLFVKPRSEDFL